MFLHQSRSGYSLWQRYDGVDENCGLAYYIAVEFSYNGFGKFEALWACPYWRE